MAVSTTTTQQQPRLRKLPLKQKTSSDKKQLVPSAPFAEKWEKPSFTLKDVQNAIPAHCFKRDNFTSFSYVARDLVMIAALWYAATWIKEIPAEWGWLKWVAWPAYWWCQGVVFTGIWVLAHECGHGGFSESATINNVTGFILHSSLLVPYFSWKITHGKHHKACANMSKDQVFLPHLRSEFDVPAKDPAVPDHEDETLFEGAPLLDMLMIVRMLLLGWPAYLINNTSGQKYPTWTSHFRPDAPIFEPKQWFQVVMSCIGVVGMFGILAAAGSHWGFAAVGKYYGVPYLFCNMWLVLITFLQHTDARVPHYSDQEWNFLLGALATVDRDYGILNHFFHHIGDTHVAHHLFSRMPHYHAQEATEHIKRVVGKYYIRDNTNIWKSLWKSYNDCRFVEDQGNVLWYKN